ncbi:glycogen debranching N-terminal domain-containing protein [Nocardioides sp.]|uniref:glycogen debranching N-terminal domain-containing protein n=1 Tax=Nocardioides sp. TaxID=35761 RepID=UPI002736C1D1|nr:glycogen debranching N-terminal domain-containing protein [Nocardioides sp.]MDP3894433.1 glycogen debranching N-terminal domain-containing protein [Nocardioides sp.]
MLPTQPHLAHLVGAFHAPVQAWSRGDGTMASGAEGVYCGDERVIVTARLEARQWDLLHVSTQVRSATEVRFVYVITAPAEVVDPLLTVERIRTVSSAGMKERLRVDSALRDPVELDLSLVLGPDATSMEQVKSGYGAPSRPQPDGPRWSWRDADTIAELEVSAGTAEFHGSEIVLGWHVVVTPGTELLLGWSLLLKDAAAPVRGIDAPPLTPPHLDTADQRLPRLVARTFSDLSSLRMVDRNSPDDVFLAAGAPWFYTLFGRDSLIAARMLLPVDRSLAEGTLRTLAARQGTTVDEATAEQPGKILHEVRRTHLAAGDEGTYLPPVYYGTIDATPLWICLLHDAWRAGMADSDVTALLGHLESALQWLGDHGDSDGDGFLEYHDTTGRGLANQGWKDSGDSIRQQDGTVAEGPIALCEVQAYAHEAAMGGAALLDAFGRDGAERWRAWAHDLRQRFRTSFWVEDEQGRFPALALDAHKRSVDSVSSNIGHLLGTGLLDPDEQRLVVERLLDPTMFSGYGIRTLSTTNGAFWPLRYHAGSVWTHDTALAIDGMLRDGFTDAAAQVAEGLLLAAEGFDYRWPELFGGQSSDEVWPPVPYPASCRPQAWAAASVVPVLRALGALPSG